MVRKNKREKQSKWKECRNIEAWVLTIQLSQYRNISCNPIINTTITWMMECSGGGEVEHYWHEPFKERRCHIIFSTFSQKWRCAIPYGERWSGCNRCTCGKRWIQYTLNSNVQSRYSTNATGKRERITWMHVMQIYLCKVGSCGIRILNAY